MFTHTPSTAAVLLLVFLGTAAVWEVAAPRRRRLLSRGLRWPTSLTLGSINGLLMMIPVTPVALAAIAATHGWGLANTLHLPAWLALLVGVPVLDLVIYLQHRVLHAVPAFWSFHRVHHADVDVDCTTAFRFHPLEALMTNVTLLTASLTLGLPPLAVMVYQGLALAMTVLEHVNGRVPPVLESSVGTLLITPATHRLHHAADVEANFGTIFTVWDRWLGTYRSPIAAADDGLPLGLAGFREPKYQTLPWVLALPFLGPDRPRASTDGSRPSTGPDILPHAGR